MKSLFSYWKPVLLAVLVIALFLGLVVAITPTPEQRAQAEAAALQQQEERKEHVDAIEAKLLTAPTCTYVGSRENPNPRLHPWYLVKQVPGPNGAPVILYLQAEIDTADWQPRWDTARTLAEEVVRISSLLQSWVVLKPTDEGYPTNAGRVCPYPSGSSGQ